MANTHTDDRSLHGDRGPGTPKWVAWVIGLIVAAVVIIALFFALGGDADVDAEPGSVDVEAPDVDADVDAPDVDVEAPDVDVDVDAEPGSVDVDDADAEADADG